jgi:hypothetical protein
VQQFPGGGTYEVMATRPRSDLYVNLPALKKLDGMLLSMLDGFCDTQFWYVDRGIVLGDSKDCDEYDRPSVRQEEKWWLPSPKLPPNGLCEDDRKRLQQCRDCTNQILKAAMAINSSVLAEMEIPVAYVESLPRVMLFLHIGNEICSWFILVFYFSLYFAKYEYIMLQMVHTTLDASLSCKNSNFLKYMWNKVLSKL